MKWLMKQLQCFSLVLALVSCRLSLPTSRHDFEKKKIKSKKEKERKQQNRLSSGDVQPDSARS